MTRKAEQLIDELLEIRYGAVQKGAALTGADVAALAARQHILVDGQRSVVVDVSKKGNEVELVYIKGAKKFGKEKFLVVQMSDKETPVQLYTRFGYDEGLTKGMRNAYSRNENKMVCQECGLPVPKYPGRYPRLCPECGAELECLGGEK